MVIVAISMIAVMGMAVLVIDVGGLLLAKRRMVTASDSAAIAAAQECAADPAEGRGIGTAQTEADNLGSDNGASGGSIVITSGTCGTTAGGTVAARYRVEQELFFAPILGLGESATISAPAKAIWGPATGATTTPPMNLYANPGGDTFPCAFESHHPCNFWFDNTAPFASSSSNWSFLALEAPGWPADVAGNLPQRGCDSRNANSLPGWTTGRGTRLVAKPTFVCAIQGNFGTGGNASPFYRALKAMEGKTFQFPVSDPALKPVTNPGAEKFAVVGFTTLKIVRVIQGNDPAINGLSGTCPALPHVFLKVPPAPAGGDTYDASLQYSLCAATLAADAVIGAPIVVDAPTAGNQSYRPPGDFTWNSSTKVITFTKFVGQEKTKDVLISFPWSTPGPCGFQTSDPNDFCLITAWQGNQLGGTIPDPTAPDFGLRATRLIE